MFIDILLEEISFRRFLDLALFANGDCIFRRAILLGAARFHFDEHQRVLVFRNNVYLTALETVVTFEDTITLFLQKINSKVLAGITALSLIHYQ